MILYDLVIGGDLGGGGGEKSPSLIPIEVGSILIDKEWEEEEIEIVAISKTGMTVRYKKRRIGGDWEQFPWIIGKNENPRIFEDFVGKIRKDYKLKP